MIDRDLAPRLQQLFRQYPFVTVTGPRQSGKTTLCRSAFPDLAYVNLEQPDQRAYAQSDPRGFLDQLDGGAIIDEIQHAPDLLSYLQVLADERRANSLFVLTGSRQFHLTESISQSLAGRTALLRLLPCSLRERRRFGLTEQVDDIMFRGFFPRILDQNLEPSQALADYVETYIERDVRPFDAIRNLDAFRQFLRLCAGRIGQLLNLSALGSDVGVSHATARAWLTVLEASYIIFRLPPYHANIRKRLVKSAKLYFYDVGLACYLLGIERPEQLNTHYLRGSLFENMVIADMLKQRYNRGEQANLSFYRDNRGLECDLLFPEEPGLTALEVKSGATINSGFFTSLRQVGDVLPEIARTLVVYGGASPQTRHDVEVVSYRDLPEAFERADVQQEIEAFIGARSGADPLSEDVGRLDDVHDKLLWPTAEAINQAWQPFQSSLFKQLWHTSTLKNHRGDSVDLYLREDWTEYKESEIVVPGFELNDETPIVIKCEWMFADYVGAGEQSFDVNVIVRWLLGGEQVTRQASIDGELLPALSQSISYRDLRQAPPTDQLVAELTKALLSRISELSGT